MTYYYIATDEGNYGPSLRGTLHKSKTLKGALAGAYKIIRYLGFGFNTVTVFDIDRKGSKRLVRIVTANFDGWKIAVTDVTKKDKPTYRLLSDGSEGVKIR